MNPVPAYVKRISNANIQHGGAAGPLVVWPSANPSIVVEPGEQLSLSLRFRSRTGSRSLDLELAPGAPEFCKLRREAKGGNVWLDIALQAPRESTSYSIPLLLTGTSPEDLRVTLDLKVPPENLSVTPREIDFGEVSLKDINEGESRTRRLGIRKQTGVFHITSLSSTLPFLRLEQQTIIDERNYLIRLRIFHDNLPAPGTYTGLLRIGTSDKLFEVPIRITLTN